MLTILCGISVAGLYFVNRLSLGGNKPLKHAYDKPEGYMKYFNEITIKPGESVSGYEPNYALHQLQKSRQSSARKNSNIPQLTWQSRGPVNVGGRTRSIIVDPDDPTGNTWFAGTASGGIWRTTDAGKSWTDIAPELPNLATTALYMAPSNHNRIYAGTGEGYGGEGMVTGNGIFVSLNKGGSWSIIPSTDGNDDFRYVNKLWVDPVNENIVIAATNTGLLRTTNGGGSWTKVFSTLYRVQDLVQNPGNPNVLYAGVNTYGIIKSVNRGLSWFRSSQSIGGAYRFALTVSRVDTAVVFTAAENQKAQMDVYISRNSGMNWRRQNDLSGTFYNFHKAQGWFNNVIKAHPFRPNEVFVGGVYLGRVSFGNTISMSTRQVVSVDTFGTENFLDFINFGGEFLGGGMSTGLEETANVDTSDFVSVELRFGPGRSQKAHRFLVPVGASSGVTPGNYTYSGYVDVPFEVWDITNNRQLMVSFRDQEREGNFNLVVRDPNNDLLGREYIFVNAVPYNPDAPSPDIARAGGHFYKMLYFFWPTLAGGAVWNPASLPASRVNIQFGQFQLMSASTEVIQNEDKNKNLHVDHHDLVFIHGNDSAVPFRIVNANDGGVAVSNNSGRTWEQLTNGYITTQFYGVAKKPGADEYIGGMQDNGTWQSPPGTTATDRIPYVSRLGGDGFQVIWNAGNNKKILGSIYNNNFYLSINGGLSWRSAANGINQDGPFMSKLSYSTAAPEVVFAVGAKGIYKHTRFGDPIYAWSLSPITRGWTLDGTAFSSLNIKVSPADRNIIWAGAGMYRNPDLNIYLSKDFGVTWDTVKNYTGENMGLISGMAVHPKNPAEAFLLFSYKGDPKILRTYDYGQTWSDISGFGSNEVSSNGFPDVIVHDLLVIPDDTVTIWAATEIGIFESTNNGATWHVYDSNLPQVSIFQVFYQDGQFVTATHGRGIWTANLWPVGTGKDETLEDKKLIIYPNPADDFTDIEFIPESSGSAEITIINLNGQVITKRKLQVISGENLKERFSTGTLQPGIYVVEVRLNGKVSTSRFVRK